MVGMILMFEITFYSLNFDRSKTVGDIWKILRTNARTGFITRSLYVYIGIYNNINKSNSSSR